MSGDVNSFGRTYRRRKRKSISSVNSSPSTESQEKFISLVQWMGAKGFKPSKKLSPVIFEESGRGLMSKERISQGDLIVSIPERLLITPKSVLNSYIGDFIIKFSKKASGHQILSIFLMCEKLKSLTSEWHPYLNSLPETYDIPAFFDSCSFSNLPLFISSLATKQVKLIKSSYKELEELLKNLEFSHPLFHNAFNFNLYKWAWCTVNTRCVYIDCWQEDCPGKSCPYHLALAPYLDLLNHSSEVKVLAGFNSDGKQYEIKSLCDFKKYSQVYINYGPHDNRSLLVEYGFILKENLYHFVPFSIDDIKSACKQCQFKSSSISEKLKFIFQNNLLSNAGCSCDGLNWNLVVILKILASTNQPKWWKSILTNSSDISAEEKLKYEELKIKLLNIKLNDYSFLIDGNCSVNYSNFLSLVLSLSSIDKQILINAL